MITGSLHQMLPGEDRHLDWVARWPSTAYSGCFWQEPRTRPIRRLVRTRGLLNCIQQRSVASILRHYMSSWLQPARSYIVSSLTTSRGLCEPFPWYSRKGGVYPQQQLNNMDIVSNNMDIVLGNVVLMQFQLLYLYTCWIVSLLEYELSSWLEKKKWVSVCTLLGFVHFERLVNSHRKLFTFALKILFLLKQQDACLFVSFIIL